MGVAGLPEYLQVQHQDSVQELCCDEKNWVLHDKPVVKFGFLQCQSTGTVAVPRETVSKHDLFSRDTKNMLPGSKAKRFVFWVWQGRTFSSYPPIFRIGLVLMAIRKENFQGYKYHFQGRRDKDWIARSFQAKLQLRSPPVDLPTLWIFSFLSPLYKGKRRPFQSRATYAVSHITPVTK